MVELKFMGAQPILYKGNAKVKFGEVISFDKDEADFRLKNHPGMWEQLVGKAPIENATSQKSEGKKGK